MLLISVIWVYYKLLMGFIKGGEGVLHFAEFGVTMMLFLVGLELQPSKLWDLRRSILGLEWQTIHFVGEKCLFLDHALYVYRDIILLVHGNQPDVAFALQIIGL